LSKRVGTIEWAWSCRVCSGEVRALSPAELHFCGPKRCPVPAPADPSWIDI
jgi:hypothetical protein